MKINLYHRHYGVHSFVSEHEIDLTNSNIITKIPSTYRGFEWVVDDKELAEKVKPFLPGRVDRCLLCIEDADGSGSTGVFECEHFLPWGKYFDAYVIGLPEPQNIN